MRVLTQNNYEILIDEQDLDLFNSVKWYVTKVGYAQGRYGVYLHRLIMVPSKGMVVDHINRNKLDNRRKNLRTISQRENCLNHGLSKNNRSGVNGVSWNTNRRKWQADASKNYKTITLGCFSRLEDAIQARKRWEVQDELYI